MKNKFLFTVILFIGACSSIPTGDENKSINTLIQKPEFNYKISSLPKSINLYFFKNKETATLPLEIQGFIENSYFYNTKISYRPKIFLSPIKAGECNIKDEKQELIIAFNLSNNTDDTYQECIKSLPRGKTLYVSNFDDNLGFSNTFIASRTEERKELIQSIKSISNRIVVIDSENTKDKTTITRLLQENKKEVIEVKTFDENLSSQDLFAEVLMVNRSKERMRKLSRRLSEKITGNSRSREDLDAFFLSVDLEEARNLKPALDYISERDYEVFILNSWQTNSNYKSLDKDLEGSIHADFPIMMPIKIPEFISNENRSREYAVGYDSFEIVLLKYGSANLGNFIYRGLSGKIRIKNNKILRSAYVFKITDEGVEIL
ncbi:MAG: penicillin-binding protein activator [Gammaproteobacteria bacterium]